MSAHENAGLIRVQSEFQRYLLNEADTVIPLIRVGGRIPVDKRLGIYHNAYRVRLLDTLRDTYEKTWTYLGDATFEQCARAYIETHPPTHRSLRDYGTDLPDWLAQQFPGDADVAELAQMDWMLRQAFDGENAEVLPLEALAALKAEDWETLQFRCVPTLALHRIRFNTAAIWRSLDQGVPPPGSAGLPDPAWLCVWRRGWQPHFRSLDETEFLALDSVRAGVRFAEVCQTLSETRPDASNLIAQYLQTWITDGLISGLVHAPGPDSSAQDSLRA